MYWVVMCSISASTTCFGSVWFLLVLYLVMFGSALSDSCMVSRGSAFGFAWFCLLYLSGSFCFSSTYVRISLLNLYFFVSICSPESALRLSLFGPLYWICICLSEFALSAYSTLVHLHSYVALGHSEAACLVFSFSLFFVWQTPNVHRCGIVSLGEDVS